MSCLQAADLDLGYNGHLVVRDLTLVARPGQVLALAGPNGAGKTTLLRGLARLLRPRRGAVLLDGRDVWAFSERQAAQRIGLVPQTETLDWPVTVEQIVALGRAPRRGWLLPLSGADHAAVNLALDRTGLRELRDRLVTRLSGGERQRLLIARALAQEPDVLLLDEPTAHLDLRYQGAVLGLARNLAHDAGLAVVMSLHDLNLVALYADRVALIADGAVIAEGAPDAVLTPTHLARAYGVPVAVSRHPVYGTPLVMPMAEV
jgi:iron complex transport system ATP-binding protein